MNEWIIYLHILRHLSYTCQNVSINTDAREWVDPEAILGTVCAVERMLKGWNPSVHRHVREHRGTNPWIGYKPKSNEQIKHKRLYQSVLLCVVNTQTHTLLLLVVSEALLLSWEHCVLKRRPDKGGSRFPTADHFLGGSENHFVLVLVSCHSVENQGLHNDTLNVKGNN